MRHSCRKNDALSDQVITCLLQSGFVVEGQKISALLKWSAFSALFNRKALELAILVLKKYYFQRKGRRTGCFH